VNKTRGITRREALGSVAALLGNTLSFKASSSASSYRLATFAADVTVPLGHALMGGGIAPAREIKDPLFVHGFVLSDGSQPVVLAAVDWCEIRNDAYDRWRVLLAEAAKTVPERVLVTSVHQHDAPVADLEAQRILTRYKLAGSICDLDFHERAVQSVAKAVKEGLKSQRAISHIGIGQAKVEGVASNRRFLADNGEIMFSRTSTTRDPGAREKPEGTIDPWLKTLSFWDADQPVLVLSCYATHPMSRYGHGEVSSDFVGLARQRRQADMPQAAQVYVSGCSGNVTAGKYNDGSPQNRSVLADRIYQAMVLAWKQTHRHPIRTFRFRSVPLRLEPRSSAGFTVEDLKHRLVPESKPFDQCLAALGLSWRKRADAGYKLDIPLLDLGVAQLLLLPGESYVEYQLFAQQLRPESFILAAGYGECATGYIPTTKAVEEGDTNLKDWCWVAPESEQAMKAALEVALKPEKS